MRASQKIKELHYFPTIHSDISIKLGELIHLKDSTDFKITTDWKGIGEIEGDEIISLQLAVQGIAKEIEDLKKVDSPENIFIFYPVADINNLRFIEVVS